MIPDAVIVEEDVALRRKGKAIGGCQRRAATSGICRPIPAEKDGVGVIVVDVGIAAIASRDQLGGGSSNSYLCHGIILSLPYHWA